MSLPDILFKGIPRQWTRGYTSDLLRGFKPERVVVPCAGAYSLTYAAVSSGIAPERVETCDITLYSSALGRLFAGRELDLTVTSDEWRWLEPYMEDMTGKVAAIILAIRILQLQAGKQNAYKRHRILELRERADAYIEQARKSIGGLAEVLTGIRYTECDLRDLMRPHYGEESTAILCNPPRYTGGYDKMYEGIDTVFEWDAPTVPQFTEADYPGLMRELGEAQALTLIYYATPTASGEDPEDIFGAPWKSVFADRPKTGKTAAINWILCNRSQTAELALKRADTPRKELKHYQLFTEGDVTPESRIWAKRDIKEQVDYYRDLLVHRLGLVNAEQYISIFLDGKLLASCGLHMYNYMTQGNPANLTFCFTPRHEKYKRLQKLALMALTSTWFWKDIMKGKLDDAPTKLQTTMFSPHPEVKTARGIFKLERRTKEKDGSFKLCYLGDIKERTREETLREFIKRFGGKYG